MRLRFSSRSKNLSEFEFVKHFLGLYQFQSSVFCCILMADRAVAQFVLCNYLAQS